MAEEQATITALNPKSLKYDYEGKCQHYRTPEKVVYAFGFVNEMNKMTRE